MELLDALARPEVWEAFYAYKTSLDCPQAYGKRLRDYIDRAAYRPVCEKISAGEPFPLPRRAIISKLHSEKKRVVYIYPEPENTVLKCMTWLLLRTGDDLFSPCLYSFRPGKTAKDAIRDLNAGVSRMYSYKVDVSNYFNSVPLDFFLPMLEQALGQDPALFSFLRGLLCRPEVRDRSQIIVEPKGIMAGTPQSSFYANLYLRDVDQWFFDRGIRYARYSDDMILFAPTEEEVRSLARELRGMLEAKGLTVNPDKECFSTPEEGWTFLGFQCRNGQMDIAPATMAKLKAKMRRKTRALARWRDRNGKTGEQTAAAFIRVFNRKLLEGPSDHELSWSHWFFSVIQTADSLREIDRYAQDCLRFLVSGKRTKARYQVRYEDLKALGYQNLVHAYYSFQKRREENETECT